MRRMYEADNGNVTLRDGKLVCHWNGSYREFSVEEIRNLDMRALSGEKDGCLRIELDDSTMIHLHFDWMHEKEMIDLNAFLLRDKSKQSERNSQRKGILLSIIAVLMTLYWILYG